MIVPEDLLAEIFAQLPPAKDSNDVSFPIRFSWGGEKDLNPYLVSLTGARYPILWLIEGTDEVDHYASTLERKVKLFLAKQSDDVNSLNPTVWGSEFTNILNPILKNVITALEKSGVTKIMNGEYRVSRRANYTEVDSNNKSESIAIDNWNVALLECTVEFSEKADGTPNCINQIRF